MFQHDIETRDVQTVEIVAAGDVTIAGWENETIYPLMEADEADGLRVERTGDLLRLRMPGDATLKIPRRLAVRLIEAGGDVHASDLDAGLEALNVAGDLHVEDVRGDMVAQSVAGDARLQRVAGTARLGTVAGDLGADELGGDLTGERVDGDLHATDCQGVRGITVAGDLRLARAQGEVAIERVAGDAELDDCRAHVHLGAVEGDLSARELDAGLSAPHVGGDFRLETAFGPGSEYTIVGNGSATIALRGEPAEASVTFELRSGEGRIDVGLPLDNIRREPRALHGRLGAGEAMVRIQSNRQIRLTRAEPAAGLEGAFGGIFEGVEEGMRGAFEGIFEGVEEGMKEAFRSPEGMGGRRIDLRMEDLAQRTAARAEEAGRRAAERVERRAQEIARRAAERAQREVERQRWRPRERTGPARAPAGEVPRGPAPPPPPPFTGTATPSPVPPQVPRGPAPPPAPPSRPRATDDERLMVLQMLRQGKISVEEAARLLDALGE
ncbi:MAG: hypothetical protein HYY04_07465 [Chloroflexi bacterium]|nr:hypothetical protein [Chloroflexota bacterium]